jgi:hypothetical protein
MPKSNDPFSGQSFAQKCPKKRTLFPGKLPATQQAFKESEKKMQPYLRPPRYELPQSMWEWPITNSEDCFSKVLEQYVPSIPPCQTSLYSAVHQQQQKKAYPNSSCCYYEEDDILYYETAATIQELRYPPPPPPAEIRPPQVTFSKNQASDAYIKRCIFGDDDKVPCHVYIVDGYIVPIQYATDEEGMQQSKKISPEYSCSSEDWEDEECLPQNLQQRGTDSSSSSSGDNNNKGYKEKNSAKPKSSNTSRSAHTNAPKAKKRQANMRMLAKAISNKRVP